MAKITAPWAHRAPRASAPGGASPRLRVSKDLYRRQMAKRVALGLAWALLLLAIVYGAAALTIVRALPVQDNQGHFSFQGVRDARFPGGLASPGTVMIVNRKAPQGTSLGAHGKQAFTLQREVARVEVVAGPYGKLTWAPSGLATVEGKPLPVALLSKPSSTYLNKQYVVKCLSGSCSPGEGFIVGHEQIYGVPLAKKE